MREITKILSVPMDGKPVDFRLMKLDAFSGTALLRMLSRMPEGRAAADLMTGLPDADLRSLMAVCLQQTQNLFDETRFPLGADAAPVVARRRTTPSRRRCPSM